MSESMSPEEMAWWFGGSAVPEVERQRLPEHLRSHPGHPAYRGPRQDRNADNARLSRAKGAAA